MEIYAASTVGPIHATRSLQPVHDDAGVVVTFVWAYTSATDQWATLAAAVAYVIVAYSIIRYQRSLQLRLSAWLTLLASAVMLVFAIDAAMRSENSRKNLVTRSTLIWVWVVLQTMLLAAGVFRKKMLPCALRAEDALLQPLPLLSPADMHHPSRRVGQRRAAVAPHASVHPSKASSSALGVGPAFTAASACMHARNACVLVIAPHQPMQADTWFALIPGARHAAACAYHLGPGDGGRGHCGPASQRVSEVHVCCVLCAHPAGLLRRWRCGVR